MSFSTLLNSSDLDCPKPWATLFPCLVQLLQRRTKVCCTILPFFFEVHALEQLVRLITSTFLSGSAALVVVSDTASEVTDCEDAA